MNIPLKKIPTLGLILIFLSCSSIVKTINGEHRPEIETDQSLAAFIAKENLPIDLNRNLLLKNETSKNEIVKSNLVYTERDSLILPYGVMLFNKDGAGISYNYIGTQACLIDEITTDSISSYLNSTDDRIKTKFRLKELNDNFIDKAGNDISPFKPNGRPTALILWAKYRGKKWAEEAKTMILSLESSPKNYNIYFLNLDPNKYYSQF